jgi:hypothetical protein
MLGPGEVEDGDAVMVGDAQRLAGPADTPATAVEAAVRGPAQDEACWACQIGAEHLMSVAGVQSADGPRQPRPSGVKPCRQLVGRRRGLQPRRSATAGKARTLHACWRRGRTPGRRRRPCPCAAPSPRPRATTLRGSSGRARQAAWRASRCRRRRAASVRASWWCAPSRFLSIGDPARCGADPRPPARAACDHWRGPRPTTAIPIARKASAARTAARALHAPASRRRHRARRWRPRSRGS